MADKVTIGGVAVGGVTGTFLGLLPGAALGAAAGGAAGKAIGNKIAKSADKKVQRYNFEGAEKQERTQVTRNVVIDDVSILNDIIHVLLVGLGCN